MARARGQRGSVISREAEDPIFHYTSASAVQQIMERRTVWASEASSLNDLAEVRQGWAAVRDWLGRQKQTDATDLLLSFADDPLKPSHEVFVLSGSTESDDANQWRLYADQARGYAIEFDPSVPMVVLADAAAEESPVVTRRGGFSRLGDFVDVTPWLHCLYSQDEVDSALEGVAKYVMEEIESMNATFDATAEPHEQDLAFEYLRDLAYEQLATVAHLIKGAGFAGEHEVRIVTTFMLGSQHIRYHATDHGLVGYVALSGDPGGIPLQKVLRPEVTPGGTGKALTLPLKSVRLGPLLPEEHINTVEGFLRKAGLPDVLVRRSEVPLRSP